MSVFPLERLFDPPAKIEARERQRQQDLAGPRKPDREDPPIFRCRVCLHESTAGDYCPTCLADTMEEAARGKGR